MVRSIPFFYVAVLLGVIIRLFVASTTDGSDDLVAWSVFVAQIEKIGMGGLYADEKLFNHPALSGAMVYFLSWLSKELSLEFSFIFRAAYGLIDCATAVALYRISKQSRLDSRIPYFWLASPLAICISSFHGNTDSLYVSLVAWALFFFASGRSKVACFLLGISASVKAITLLLIPALVIYLLQNKCERLNYIFMAIGLLPCVIGGLIFPGYFSNVFMYVPASHFYWGIGGIVKLASDSKEFFAPIAKVFLLTYFAIARYMVPCSVIAVSMLTRHKQLPLLMLCSFLTALCLSPGVGVQYLLLASLLLFIVSTQDGVFFSILSFAYALTCYSPATASFFKNGRIESYTPSRISIFLGVVIFAYMVDVLIRMTRKEGGTVSSHTALT
jgi:hypothetical protein